MSSPQVALFSFLIFFLHQRYLPYYSLFYLCHFSLDVNCLAAQEHNQTTNDVRYFQRLYDFGQLYGVNLFLDFEDWRTGSRGFSWTGVIPPTAPGASSITRARALEGTIRGAHFSPFDQRSLGPDIPCYLKERNQGLVLDRSLQRKQIDQQSALVDDLQGRVAVSEANL